MKSNNARVFLVLCIVFVSGCAGIPDQSFIPGETLNPGKIVDVKKVALLSVPNPPHYWFGEDPAMAGGLFGGLGFVVGMASVGEAADGKLSFDFSETMQNALKSHFSELQLEVYEKEVNRPKPHELLSDYSGVGATEVDAYLDIAPVEVGFKVAGFSAFSNDNGPHVSVVARLVDANDFEVIYEGSFQYGWGKNPLVKGVSMEAPESHSFDNQTDLKERIDQGIEFLNLGVDMVARSVVGILRPYN